MILKRPLVLLTLAALPVFAENQRAEIQVLQTNIPLVNKKQNTSITWEANGRYKYSVLISGECNDGVASRGAFSGGYTEPEKQLISEILAYQLQEGLNRFSICLFNDRGEVIYRFLGLVGLDSKAPLSQLSINAGGELVLACQDDTGCAAVEIQTGEAASPRRVLLSGDSRELVRMPPPFSNRGYYSIRYRAVDLAGNKNAWQETRYRFFSLSRLGLEPFFMAKLKSRLDGLGPVAGLVVSYERGLDDLDVFRSLARGSSLLFPALRVEAAASFSLEANSSLSFFTAGLLWRIPVGVTRAGHLNLAGGAGPAFIKSENTLASYLAAGYEYNLGQVNLFGRLALRYLPGAGYLGLAFSAGALYSW